MIRLELWSLVSHLSPYQAPELATRHLHGVVYGHPRIADGSEVTTSEILEKKHGFVKTSSGSEYLLGTVDPAYEKAFPDAYKRLFK